MDAMASIFALIAVSANQTIASQNVTNNERVQFPIRLSECVHCSASVSNRPMLCLVLIAVVHMRDLSVIKIDDCSR